MRMKRWLVIFVVTMFLIPVCGNSEANPILVPQWWNAPVEVIIDARDRLNRAIVDKGGEAITTSGQDTSNLRQDNLQQNNTIPSNQQQNTVQTLNSLPENPQIYGNVTINAVGSETKSISHQVVSANFTYWQDNTVVDRFACIEIMNTGKEYIYMDNCDFEFEDANGKLIDSENTFVIDTIDVIGPGERGYFYVSAFNGGMFDKEVPYADGYRLVINYSLERCKEPYIPFEIVESNLTTADSFGKKIPKVTGRLRNNSTKDESLVYVTVVYKDSKGKVLFINGTNVSDVYAGIVKGFDINSIISVNPELKNENIGTFEIYAGPHYYQH